MAEFSTDIGGRGGFGNTASSGRGGRGGFAMDNTNQDNGYEGRAGFSSDGNRGGRGGFGDRGGRRGGFNDNSEDQGSNSGRGGSFNARGGSRGGFSNDNSSNQGGSNDFGRGGFRGSSDGYSGGNRGGRGGFGDDGSSGGNRGGRGGFGDDGSSGGNRGGRGGFGGSSDGFSGGNCGGFGDDGSSGGNRGGRGGFRGSSDGYSGNRGGRGGFGDDGSSGGNRGGRGGFGDSFDGTQGGNRGGRRGGFGGTDDQASTGFGRGGSSNNRGRFDNEGQDNANGGGFGDGSGGGNRGRGRGGRGNSNYMPLGERKGGFGSEGGFGGDNRNAGGFDNEGTNEFGGRRNNQDNSNEGNDENRPPIPNNLAPRGWAPKVRDTEQLFSEDQNVGELYANVCADDEELTVEGLDVVKIETWKDADFPEQLMSNLKRCRYIKPRNIQCVALPYIIDGYDVKAQAETGSGKTAAFLLPIIDSCMRNKVNGTFKSDLSSPFALIIGPTRELVLQVYEQARKFAEGTGVSVAKAYGQYSINVNHKEIRDGCDILCGTPGRLKHFIKQGDILVKNLKFLVLDEADQLLDDQFNIDIEEITNMPSFPSSENRQTLLFSATFPPTVMDFANKYVKSESAYITNKKSDANKRIIQEFQVIPSDTQIDHLHQMLKDELDKSPDRKLRRTLVFTNTKRKADMVALYLCNHDIKASSINGDRGQNLREESLSNFRDGEVSVLVSTDVCARGIDIKGLDHVINLGAPNNITTYIHRIGRTGRIRQGYATTIVDYQYDPLLPQIKDMMEGSGKEVPESLKQILSSAGPVDQIAQSFNNCEINGGGDNKKEEDW